MIANGCLRDVVWLSELLGGVPHSTISSWVHRRQIPHLKIGRLLRFDEAEIRAWIEARRVAATPIDELRVARQRRAGDGR